MTPQASDELRARWRNDHHAMNALSPGRFTFEGFTIRPRPGVAPTEEEFSAIDYMVSEWDYGWDCKPLA